MLSMSFNTCYRKGNKNPMRVQIIPSGKRKFTLPLRLSHIWILKPETFVRKGKRTNDNLSLSLERLFPRSSLMIRILLSARIKLVHVLHNRGIQLFIPLTTRTLSVRDTPINFLLDDRIFQIIHLEARSQYSLFNLSFHSIECKFSKGGEG